jgi:hypothetical protein
VNTVNCFDRFEIVQGYRKLCNFGQTNLSNLKEREDFSNLPHSFIYGALDI